nr:Gag-Pol polyprotein [Tanacetum cinerariifolium]
MRTRNSYFLDNSSVTIPRHRNKRHTPNVVKPELRTIVEIAPRADNRTMEELLQAPTEGYGEAIVIPEINADHFEIKTNLLQLEVDDLKAERLAKTQDPLALMVTSKNPYTFPVLHQDQPSFNQKYMQQPIPNPKDIIDPTTAMNMSLALMDKAFKLNYSTQTNNNQRISSNPGGNANQNRNGNLVAARAEGNATGHNGNQKRCYNCKGLAADLDEIMEVNANYILMATLQQASTSGTQTDKPPVYDSDESAEGNATGHNGNQKRCYNCKGLGHFTRNCTVRPRRRDAAYLQTQLLIA